MRLAKLVDQLLKSFAAIEAEKDPAPLQQKLAEHGSLLKELQTKGQATRLLLLLAARRRSTHRGMCHIMSIMWDWAAAGRSLAGIGNCARLRTLATFEF